MGNVNGNIIIGVVVSLTTVAIGAFEFILGKKVGYLKGKTDATIDCAKKLEEINNEFLEKYPDISVENKVEEKD